jgi:hypothetical protein
MSSALGTPSKKFSWLKKMEAKIEKSEKNSEQDHSSGPKTSSKKEVEIVHKSE